MIAGLVALKGPRHGGAGVLAARLVETLVDGDVAPRRSASASRSANASPASATASTSTAIRARTPCSTPWRAPGVGKARPRNSGTDRGSDRRIRQYRLCARGAGRIRSGLPPGNELVLFAMARTVGWIAHASEQLRHGELIRPRARYIGPAPGRSAGVRAFLVKTGPDPSSGGSEPTESLRGVAVAGSITPPPCLRRIAQTASATISAPPMTSGIQ